MIRQFLFALAIACPAHAQSFVGEGTIIVEARDALTNAPLSGTRLTIKTGNPQSMLWTSGAVTGPDGIARFTRLTAETYRITYERSGYVGSDSTGEVLQLNLGGGETTETLRIALTPFSTMEGTVTDEDGLPMSVTVYTRRGAFEPQRRTTSGKDGRFSINNVMPGDYRVEVVVPYEVRQSTLKRNPDTGEVFGYPPVCFYPGDAERDTAIAVQATPGTPVTGLHLHLRRARLVELSGKVEGQPGARVELLLPHVSSNEPTYMLRPVAQDGGFQFKLLQPGHYDLAVHLSATAGNLPWLMPVDVGKAGLADLRVAPPPHAELTARVLPLAGDADWNGQVSLSLTSAAGSAEVVLWRSDGTVRVPPGEWTVSAYFGERRVRGVRPLAIGRVTLGLQDALAGPVTISESGNPPMEVTLTPETGGIRGVVDGGQSKLHIAQLRRTGLAARTEFVNGDGTFAFEALAPGAYDLSVRVEGSSWDPRAPGTRIQVKAGDTASIRVSAAK